MRGMGELLLLMCVATVVGCENAPEWAPGAKQYDMTQVPTRAGTFLFTGERDTIITADLHDNDGVNFPNGYITVERVASGPLATRGAQQLGIEGQRIAATDRRLAAIEGLLRSYLPPAQVQSQWLFPTAQPAAADPKLADRIAEALLPRVTGWLDAELDRRGVRSVVTSQPAVP